MGRIREVKVKLPACTSNKNSKNKSENQRKISKGGGQNQGELAADPRETTKRTKNSNVDHSLRIQRPRSTPAA